MKPPKPDRRHMLPDGQYHHSRDHAMLDVDEACVRLVVTHMRDSDCIPKPIDPAAQVPVRFILDDKSGSGVVVCGVCSKELGPCNVRKIEVLK